MIKLDVYLFVVAGSENSVEWIYTEPLQESGRKMIEQKADKNNEKLSNMITRMKSSKSNQNASLFSDLKQKSHRQTRKGSCTRPRCSSLRVNLEPPT